MKRKESGVITIYLALTLSIILAFIVTTIEVARVETAKTYIARVLQTSLESSLCDYYLPLFEEYHLLGLNLESGTLEEKKSRLNGMIQDKMNDSLAPDEDPNLLNLILNGSKSSFLMCNPTISKLTIDNCILLPDDGYVYAKNQMVAYSKYQAPMELIENVMGALGLMEETQKKSDILQEKMELEQQIAQVDEYALRLVEYVEGINTNQYGIDFTTFTKSITNSSNFAKQIVNTEPTMQSVLISNSDIFKEIEDEFLQFSVLISELLQQGIQVMSKSRECESNYLVYEEEEKAIEQGYYSEQEVKEKKKENDARADELIAAYGELDVLMKQFEVANSRLIGFTDCVSGVFDMTKAALVEITNIRNIQNNIKEGYDAYILKLMQPQEGYSKEFLLSLLEESETIKKYADKSENNISVIIDLNQMEQTLVNNLDIMNQILMNKKYTFSTTEEGFESWKGQIEKLEQQLLSISIDGLEFDYTNLDVKQGGVGVFKFITMLFETSLVDIVAGKLQVSEETINKDNLVSKHQSSSESFCSIDKDDMQISKILSGGLALGDRGFDTEGVLGDMVNKLLLASYVNTHMINFTSAEQKEDYGLHYEQEYIISGNYEDEENLNQVVLYLLLYRLLMNCVSIMTDSEKGRRAEATAVAVIGWVPITGLTSLVKYLILIYWAYCEAVVQVSALLHGKSVPILATENDFVVLYSDIYMISDSYVEERASKYDSKNHLTLNYTQCLFLLHLFISEKDTVGRALDLIQENIEYEYDDSFLITNCLISFSCEVDSMMEPKFSFLPYFQNHQITLGSYQIQAKASVTY